MYYLLNGKKRKKKRAQENEYLFGAQYFTGIAYYQNLRLSPKSSNFYYANFKNGFSRWASIGNVQKWPLVVYSFFLIDNSNP